MTALGTSTGAPLATSPFSQTLSTVARSRWVLVAVHVPLVVFLIGMGATGFGVGLPPRPGIALPAGLALGALQLRHSLAFADRRRPRFEWFSFGAVIALAVIPMLELGLQWQMSLWFIGATAAMVAPPPLRPIALLLPAALNGIWQVQDALHHHPTGAMLAWMVVYIVTVTALGSVGIYGAARLVQLVDELHDARTAIAQLAIDRERLRISRDLHDILGQSLSAVSLKGDLALRLLIEDPTRARDEVRGLTDLARATLRDVRAVALDERAVSLPAELDGAVALLRAADIDVHTHIEIRHLHPQLDALLGWAVREGVTNILRHAAASACAIRVTRSGGDLSLEIANDGAIGTVGEGRGIAGVAERASALDGVASAHRSDDGWFRLQVTVPEPPA